jgi:glycosyltransferase involved in cell wall biosynthesis
MSSQTPTTELPRTQEPSEVDLPRSMNAEPTDRPLKIAIVYSRAPIPMYRGDQLTVSNLISYLSKRGHEVDLYTLNSNSELPDYGREWLKDHTTNLHIYNHGKAQIIKGLVIALFQGWPLQIGYFYNPTLTRDVRNAIEEGKYDIVYVYYIRSATVIGTMFEKSKTRQFKGRTTASFLAMQLSQSLNVERIYRNQKGLLKKLFYRFEWLRLVSFESKVWQRTTKSVLIGPKDVEAVNIACRTAGQPEIDNWVYGAHGTDTDKFRPAEPGDVVPGRVVMSGSMAYRPNIQAAVWFVENCWESIKQKVPDAHLYLVGHKPAPEILAMGERPDITVTGSVPDVGVYIRSAAVCINPVQAAAGMQNKLVEYLASGKAIVATSVSNEGIMAPADVLRIADTPEDFSANVVDLLNAPEVAEDLGQKARDYAHTHWTWEAHFKILEQNYLAALTDPKN